VAGGTTQRCHGSNRRVPERTSFAVGEVVTVSRSTVSTIAFVFRFGQPESRHATGFTWKRGSTRRFGVCHPILEWNDDTPPSRVDFLAGHRNVGGYLQADFMTGDHIITTANGTIVSNAWQVALTIARQRIARLFVNGVMLSEQNLGTVSVRNTGNLYIGARLLVQPKFFKVSLMSRACTTVR